MTTLTPGTVYYYRGFAAPFQQYTITSIVKDKIYTTESSAGMNNEMYKWFRVADFNRYIAEGLIIIIS